MLSFNPVSINDRNIFQNYFSKSNKQNCDYTFSNIFSWLNVYKTEWCESNGFLLIRFHINGKKNIGYMEPLGEGDLMQILHYLQDDAHAQQQPLRFLTLSPSFVERLKKTDFYSQMYWYKNSDFFDYIYSTQKLATLSGKKLQAKRNHVHQFQHAYPDYRYESLNRTHFAAARQVLDRWEETEKSTPQLLSEKAMIINSLNNFEALQLQGGILYVQNQPVAFTFGSELRKDTFCCHVEKADVRYEGAFSMINFLFANDLLNKYDFINREEDLGLKNLRKSKQSYLPERMEEKFEAVEKASLDFQVMQLWQTSFGDSDSYIAAYLHNYFHPQKAVLQLQNNHLTGMFHLHTFDTHIGHVGYLFALAVEPSMQHRRHASKIVEESLKKQQSEHLFLTTLITYTDALVAFYQRFGFAYMQESSIVINTPDSFDFGADPTQNIHFLYRILNVEKYLQTFAEQHPERSFEGAIKDDFIPENTGKYLVHNGKATFEPCQPDSYNDISELFIKYPLIINEMDFFE